MGRMIDLSPHAGRAVAGAAAAYADTRRGLDVEREELAARRMAEADESALRQARIGVLNAQADGLRGQGRSAGIPMLPSDKRALEFAQTALEPEQFQALLQMPEGARRNAAFRSLNAHADELEEQERAGVLFEQMGSLSQGGAEGQPGLYTPEEVAENEQAYKDGGITLTELQRDLSGRKRKAAKGQAQQAIGQRNLEWASARLADEGVKSMMAGDMIAEEEIMGLIHEYQIDVASGNADHARFKRELELATMSPETQDYLREQLERAESAEAVLELMGATPEMLEGARMGNYTEEPIGAPSRGSLSHGEEEAGGVGGAAKAAMAALGLVSPLARSVESVGKPVDALAGAVGSAIEARTEARAPRSVADMPETEAADAVAEIAQMPPELLGDPEQFAEELYMRGVKLDEAFWKQMADFQARRTTSSGGTLSTVQARGHGR